MATLFSKDGSITITIPQMSSVVLGDIVHGRVVLGNLRAVEFRESKPVKPTKVLEDVCECGLGIAECRKRKECP